jgi:acetoin utilization deacetylase AcuC-like enzyme
MGRVGFVYDDLFLEHRTPPGHPENGARLEAITKHLKETGLWEKLTPLPVRLARDVEITAVHSEEHLARIREVCRAGGGMLDQGDTYASARSCEVAEAAAGAVLAGIDGVASGTVEAAFCAVRPPGHHAERDAPLGFCLLNNVAIGARYAQKQCGIEKVAIVDWDVHHGNGTQHTFEEDPTVLYISLHQYPHYPGSGAREERGKGRGEGFTLNFPFPAGTGGEEYLRAFREEIVPALKGYAPGLILVSAGFDAHLSDPLAGMLLTEENYAEMTRMLKPIGPIVSVLEGGYDFQALARSVESHLRSLEGA